MAIAGIDPGAHGAIALLDDRVRVYDMPVHYINIGGKKRARPDLHGLVTLFDVLKDDVSLCVIEDVGPMPKDGRAAAFAFGWAAACPNILAAAAGWRVHLARPSVWKVQMGLAGQTKDGSRRKASQLFPGYSHLWARAKDDGRAEATLLAYYGSRIK